MNASGAEKFEIGEPKGNAALSDTAQAIAPPKQTHRSRVTNGSALLPGIDGRSQWARRLRDVVELHIDDLGGRATVSEAERSIVRRIATLTVELERMESAFARDDGAKPADLALYQTTSNTLRRLLESIGIKRRVKDITPELHEYLAGRGEAAA